MAELDDIVRRLDGQLRRERRYVEWVDKYYEGEQPLLYMAAALAAEVGDRITQAVINWPRMVADVYETVLDIEGIRYTGTDVAEDLIWEMWTDNDGAMCSMQCHLEAVINGRAAVIAGRGDNGLEEPDPLMSAEHPYEVTFRYDPRTGRPIEAMKRWRDTDSDERATLYLPDSTVQFVRRALKDGGWVLTDGPDGGVDEHGHGAVLATSLVNRPRLLRINRNALNGGRLGRSEFHDIIPIADMANKMATDMMTSGEFHAMPRRWAVGVSEDDFVDEQGNQLNVWEQIAGRLWASNKKPSEVEFGQFPESDLTVFHNTIKLLAQLASQLAFLPQDYMSFTSDNPTSADAIRASETRKVKWAERKQTFLAAGWRRHLANMVKLRTGKWPERPIEIIWRDPSTPTVAQMTDAIVKQTQGPRPIIPLEFAREKLGYTKDDRRRMAEMDREEAGNDPLVGLAAQFNAPVVEPPVVEPPFAEPSLNGGR